MTYVWVVCIWTVIGVPAGMLIGSMLARSNPESPLGAEEPLVGEPSRHVDVGLMPEMPLHS